MQVYCLKPFPLVLKLDENRQKHIKCKVIENPAVGKEVREEKPAGKNCFTQKAGPENGDSGKLPLCSDTSLQVYSCFLRQLPRYSCEEALSSENTEKVLKPATSTPRHWQHTDLSQGLYAFWVSDILILSPSWNFRRLRSVWGLRAKADSLRRHKRRLKRPSAGRALRRRNTECS